MAKEPLLHKTSQIMDQVPPPQKWRDTHTQSEPPYQLPWECVVLLSNIFLYYSRRPLYCQLRAVPAIAAATTVSIYSACVFRMALNSAQGHFHYFHFGSCVPWFFHTCTTSMWHHASPWPTKTVAAHSEHGRMALQWRRLIVVGLLSRYLPLHPYEPSDEWDP